MGWKTKHEVDANVVEASSLGLLDGFCGLGGGVASMQELQSLVVEGLYAHAQSVYAQCVQSFYEFFHVVGIALHGNFPRAYIIHIIYSVQHSFDVLKGKLRGGASAKVDGLDGLPLQIVFAQLQFATHRACVVIAKGQLGGREKTAVDATTFVKGNVNVYASHDVSFLL